MENKKVDEKQAQNLLQQINEVVSELEKDADMKKEVEALHKIFLKVSKTIKR
jgi:5-methylthioribose kinase